MANIKITALPLGTPNGTDVIPGVDTLIGVDGITKKYLRSDELKYFLTAQGLTAYSAASVATTGALTVTYANGTLGVGATLTNAGAQVALTIDGVLMTVAARVLVKNQASTFQNGIYTVTTVGTGATNWVLTRATDYDQAAEVIQYGVVPVSQGTINAGLVYQETGAGPFTIGTTPITFTAYSVAVPTGAVLLAPSAAQTIATYGLTVPSLVLSSTPLAVSSGGTAIATATAYSLMAAGTTATGAWQSVGTGSAGQMLQSGGAAALPAWTTATFPAIATGTGTILRANGTNWVASTSTFADTYAVSTMLYASGSNVVSGLATTNRASLATSATGVPQWLALTDGQLVIGSTAGAPAAGSLTAGAGVSISNASNSITITATGGGLATVTITGTTQTAVVSTKYIALNAGQTTLTLPSTYAVGDVVSLIGATANTGGWVVQTAVGDTIRVNNVTTSVSGTVTCTAVAGQTITLVADVANTSWVMISTSSVLLTTT